MVSCIYDGVVRHRRFAPVAHDFRYRLFMMYLDLSELPAVFDGSMLWSARRPAPAWFRRGDYLGDDGTPLDEAVRQEVEAHTGRRPAGPIRMLTHLRYFGYVMNPVSFYYCFHPETERVESVVAEITNTPWGERHSYVLDAGDHAMVTGRAHELDKAFHISPFMGMEQGYAWRFGEPGRRLHVHMESFEDQEKVFDASLSMERREITHRSLRGALVRHPWMTARVALGIYWQALRLRLKGAPYHEHPNRATT